MDSTAGYATGARQPRSGGKIVRTRRSVIARTPYDRPSTALRDPLPQNPSWISRLSGIASGAGKFISSVVFSDSSEEDEDSSSDIDGDDDVENITDEDLVFNAQQPTIQQPSSKRVIEQLLMQETFVREEGDRLIDIIKARVVDHPSVPTALEGRHTNNELTSDVNVGEMSSKAVMEARKWLEQKKLRSSSKNKETEDGTGSPVDVAKSYMRARVPWGSPAVTNSEFRSPSSAGTKLLKEGTPFPYRAGILSSSKLKRKSGSNQSWNIQDELRKVRAKATEQMLKSPSSIASLEPKVSPYAVVTDMLKRNAASVNAGGAVRNEQSGVLPNSAIPTSGQNQTTEANQAVEETGVLHTGFLGLDETFISTQRVKPSEDTNTAPQSGIAIDDFNDHDGDFIQPSSTIEDTPNVVLGLGATLDPTGKSCIPKDVFETSIEADEIRAACPTSNGLPSSSPSSPVAVEGQPKPKPREETESSWPIAGTPDDDLTIWNGSDGMINNENNDSDASASHNSSNTHEEAFPGDQSVPNANSVSSSPLLAYRGRGRGGRGRGRGRGIRGKGKAK